MYRFDSSIYTRENLARALRDMLNAVRPYFVNEHSGFDFGSSGGCYTPEGTFLEGWARQLWGIAPFLSGGFEYEHMDEFLEGFKTGPDRENHFYWGSHKDFDQRFVESASIAASLLLAPEKIWEPLSDREKRNLYLYLDDMNHHKFVDNNWVLFRVLVNLAFESLGLPFSEEHIQEDIERIESFYVKDGWYRDKVPFDYYNSWALHFYMLIYYTRRKDKEPERCEKIKERAMLFANEFKCVFNEEGGNVPFGRSLTYRFASVAFFAGAAYAGIEVLPWGEMKGIVLRNLRWWLGKNIWSPNGVLTVGFWYNTNVIQDEYNAPGCPYWALKSFIILALSDEHPFWKAEELPLSVPKVKYLEVPSGIVVHTDDDDVIYLNNGQNPPHRMNQINAKYCKFAYSVERGFTGDLGGHNLQHLGLDNSLLFAEVGDEYYRTRDYTLEKSGNEKMLKSYWKPMRNVECTTYLIPHKNWHVRIHEIVTDREIETYEGGFSITQYMGIGHETEAAIRDNLTISYPWGYTSIYPIEGKREGFVDTPMTNTNSNYPNVLIPALKGKLDKGRSFLITLVGIGKDPDGDQSRPTVEFDSETRTVRINGEKLKLL